MDTLHMPRIVVGGATSGVGKTVITCGLIYGLRRRGYTVQPFKVGPDYIDPTYLGAVSENAAHNLDVWLMGAGGVTDEFVRHSGSDISVIEGVMGYYDGLEGSSNRASTHHVATILGARTILVLDASKTGRSIAAAAEGFARFHGRSRIAGVIINRVAGRRHAMLCTDALSALGIPVVGVIPRDAGVRLQSRHLGLVPATADNERRMIQRAAGIISEFVDIDMVVSIAQKAGPLRRPALVRAARPRCVMGVALDDSFNFYYASNLESLRRRGAAIRFFSPISDQSPPRCDGLYLGGGFPEVMPEQLAENRRMRDGVKKMAEGMAPVYAECGGLMYLTRSIRAGRKRHPMAGLIDAETIMTKRMTLNYTDAEIVSDCIISGPKRSVHGHEFHYSELASVPGDARFAYRLRRGVGIAGARDGIMQYNTLASYGHLFFGTDRFAENIVRACTAAARR